MRNAITSVRLDLTYAARTFLRNPGLVAVVMISVALAIAANTTVFTIVNATLLGSLPVREPERLVNFNESDSMSYPDYKDYRDQTNVFEGVCAYFPLAAVSLGGGEPERIWGQLVSGNYFSVMGLQPALGRGILPDEDAVPGRDAVVVISSGLWQRRFGGDPKILGRQVIMNNRSFTVVGVAPAGFQGEARGILADFWAPLAMNAQIVPELAKDAGRMTSRNDQWISLVARLKPGVSKAQAQAAVNVVKDRIDRLYRSDQKNRTPLRLTPAGGLPGLSDTPVFALLSILTVVVVLVLLIACANIANLLLARATARQKEIGIRLAIGAGRGRLIRQLLTESILLSALGAIAGFLLSLAATRAIGRLQISLPFPIGFDFSPDLRVFAFTAGLSVITGILFGLAPALRATKMDLVSAFKGPAAAGGGLRRFGLRNLLVVVQVALSLVLLVSSGLFLRSLQHASSIDIGIRATNVLTMAIDPTLNNYSVEKSRQLVTQLRERISAVPGVSAVTFVNVVPLSIAGIKYSVTGDGAKSAEVNLDVFKIGTRYFETMGIPILRGRDFNPRAGLEDSVILNENAAARLFPGEDALGRRIRDHGKSYQVIAVVRNSKVRTLGENVRPCIYHMFERDPNESMSLLGMAILVKTTGDPTALIRPVKTEIHALDPNMAVFNIETMQEHVNKAMLLPRLSAALLGTFGTVALLLATAGLYGVMSYSVRRRTREIGIRIAMGARTPGVVRMIVGHGMLVAGAGLSIGIAIALAVSRFTASLLYGISATDTVTFVGVPALLLGVAFVATLVPAFRAARVDPCTALRHE